MISMQKILLLLSFLLVVSAQNSLCDNVATGLQGSVWNSQYPTWSDWTLVAGQTVDFTSSITGNPLPCMGRCGTGRRTITRTRACCASIQSDSSRDDFSKLPQCEGDSKKKSTQNCQLPNSCKSADSYRRYDDYNCKDKQYAGVAGSPGACKDLVKSQGLEKDDGGFMLECYDNSGDNPNACYSCIKKEIEPSDCGSRVWLKPDYTWNYAIFGLGFGLAFLTLLSSFITYHFGWCVADDAEKTKVLHNLDDELSIPMDHIEGPWIRFFPEWADTSTMTVFFCLMGFSLGAMVNIGMDDVSDKQRSDILELIYYPGELWINVLKALVTPLILFMMVTLPDRIQIMGSQIGQHLLLFYVCTSGFAACEGLIWVNIIKPGDVDLYIEPEDASVDNNLSELDSLLGIGRKALPNNFFGALTSMNILAIVVYGLLFGIMLQTSLVKEEWRRTFLNYSKGALKGIMLLIPYVISFTPIAMLCIVTNKISGVDNLPLLLQTEAFYLLTVIIGQGIHSLLFYPILLFFASKFRINAYRYFMQVRKAPFTAFATSSSAATMPVTLETCKDAGVMFEIVDFIVPLGAAINMDGTSLGFPIMVMFTAQLNDYEVDAGTQIVIALLSMTCSIGTAPIPNAGIVYLAMLFTAAGGVLAQESVIAQGLAMIMVLDWFVDRVETAQNVWSDCCACKLFDTWGYQELKKEKDLEMAAGSGSVQEEKRSVEKGTYLQTAE